MEVVATGRADEPFDYKEELKKYNDVIIGEEESSYDDSKSLIECIMPSKDMREYHKKLNYKYDDFTIAALISWSEMPFFRKVAELKKLRESCKDSNLKKQIDDYIDYLEYSYKSIKHNEDKGFIYELTADFTGKRDFEEVGFFVNYEDALDFSKRAVGVERRIEKIWTVKNREEYAEVEDDFLNCGAGCVYIDKNGVISGCYAYDVPEPPFEQDSGLNSFHTSYIKIPYPFRQGDIVRILNDDNRLGIVQDCKTEEEIEEVYQRYKDMFDYTDYQVIVESYYYDPSDIYLCWGHNHISPLNLEYADIDSKNVDEDSEENLFLTASRLVKGEGVLYGLEYVESKYRKRVRREKSSE